MIAGRGAGEKVIYLEMKGPLKYKLLIILQQYVVLVNFKLIIQSDYFL